VTTSKQELESFIRSTFRSVWSLELLLFLKAHGERSWSRRELIEALRGSQVLVARGAEALLAAGLLDVLEDGTVCYRVASADLERWVTALEIEYSRSPDAVRRTIIAGTTGSDLAAFSDAFRWRFDR
jgi:hypothetical protein